MQNGWQGLTFVAMDLLEPFGMDYVSAIEVSIHLHVPTTIAFVHTEIESICNVTHSND